MSEQSLLNKERNFLELNQELEEKVKSLMVEVDSIISKQEVVIRKPNPATRNLWKNNNYHRKAQSLTDSDSDDERETDGTTGDCKHDNEIDDEKIARRKKRSTNETIIRFLKAQIVKLQADLQAAQRETKKKNDCCKELEAEIKKHEGKKEKLHNQIASQKETILKAEVSINDLNAKIQSQTSEILSLRKEVEGLKKDLKSLNQLSSNNDLRFNRSLEENERLKSSLKTSQAEEKELREQIRKIQEEKRLSIKNLDKQRMDIFQAFKKQSQLVDNLKKQKAYLEASKEIQFIEEDFTRLLEWKPDA